MRHELVQLGHPGIDHPLDCGMDQLGPLDQVDHRLLDAPPADQVIPGRKPDVRSGPTFLTGMMPPYTAHMAW